MQSGKWADFKELEGYQTFRYGIFINEVLLGGCIFYFYPHESRANILSAPGGPLLPVGFEKISMKLLTECATNLAYNLGAIMFRIEPLWTTKPDYLAQFQRAPVDLLPSETLLIDLSLTETELLTAMKPKGRYNLRQSYRYGVTTEFTNEPQAISQFYDLFWQTVKEKQFFGEPYGFFVNLCQTLFPAQIAEIGFAYWQGEILATILVIYWGQKATYLYGGRRFKYSNVMASYQLHWTAMQRAKARNCRFYDFYGFSNNPNHAYAKFSRFKRQFGGFSVETIGAQDYFFYDHLADIIIPLLQQFSGAN